MARYASMSFSPRNVRNACIACDTRPPASTTSSYARAAPSSHRQVSSNALICAAACVPSRSANKGSAQIAVESTTGAVAVGKGGSCCRWLSPIPVPHSSPWLRFQSPLIEPDMQISRIRLSDEIMPSPTESSPYAAQDA